MRRAAHGSRPGPSKAYCLLLPLALWNLAVVEPLYSIVARHPPFLAAHRADWSDLAWLAAGLSLGLPALVGGCLLVIRRWSPRAAWWSLTALCGLAAAMATVQLLPVASPLPRTLLAAGAGFALAAAAHARLPAFGRLLAWCAVGALFFPCLLLWRAEPAASSPSWREALTPAAARTPRPVVLVIFDEWPLTSILSAAETIDRQRFPHLAALADTAVWYPDATTVAATTALATPAILAGRVPEPGRRAVVDDLPVNLFTLLSTSLGIHAVEASSALCPPDLCAAAYASPWRRRWGMLADLAVVALHRLAPAPWAAALPAVDQDWAHFGSGAADPTQPAGPGDPHLQLFAEFLERMADPPRATLHFLHLHIPHLPWRRLPSGQGYEWERGNPHGLVIQQWAGSEWEMLQAWQRHLLQVGLVDTLVGRLMARLRQLGLDDEALVIVTSDHGTSFRHQGLRRNISSVNLTELVNVPLFVRLPGAATGLVDRRNATTLDLLPTILDTVGLDVPPELPGRSLLGPPPESDAKLTYRGRSSGARSAPLHYRAGDLDRAEVVERTARWFGTGDWSRVFRSSLRPDLLDRSPTSLLDGGRPVAIRLTQGRGLRRFDPEADVLPIHLGGTLPGRRAEQAPVDLAIAIGDRIVATTRSFVDPQGGHAFTALIDPARLERGANELSLFVVVGDESSPRLRPTRLTGREERRR